MSISVKYIDAPEGAQEAAVVTSNDGQPFGSEQYLSGEGFADTPWATLEPNGWPLDGSRKLFKDNPQDVGWWSKERSGEDGRFETPPSISLILDPNKSYTAPGLTFRFWPSMNNWCSEMQVTWYYTETVVAQATVYPDNAEWVLDQEVEGFNWIEIDLLATNIPGQFAKLQHIQIGQVIVFLQDELVRVSLLNEVDPSSCELSADELTVEILEKKGRVLRPQKNQPMQLYHNGKLIAAHYITESSRETINAYTFRCHSTIGRLEDTFLGGFYSNTPLEDLLGSVLGGFPFVLDGSFAGWTITGYLPVCTCREALQQIAFAIGAVVTTQGDGTIQIAPLTNDDLGVFDRGNIFAGAKLTQEAQTAAIRISAHQYTKSEEIETLLDGIEVLGDGVLVTFSEPHYDYEFDGLDGMGMDYDSGYNWVTVTVTEPETTPSVVTVRAKKYIHTTQVFEQRNEKATAADKGNIVTVDSATLIQAGNVRAALDRLAAYHKLKNVLTQEVVVTDQKVGQRVESCNPWETITRGYLTSMESEFTGTGRTANVTIRGVEVPASEAEVLTV